MDQLFFPKVALAFVVAGAWVTFVTLLAERFGSKTGGLIANMPSNIFVSMIFIGLTQNADFAAQVAAGIPEGMAIVSLFLFTYVVAVKRYGVWAFLPAFAVWGALTLAAGAIGTVPLAEGVGAYAITVAVLFAILEYRMKIPTVKTKPQQHPRNELLLRAVFSGGLVAAVVVIAAALGPVWGALAGTFPAVIGSAMYIVTKSQGNLFAQGFGKVMLFASTNIVVYAVAIHYAFPAVGIWWGTLIAYACAGACVFALRPFVKKMA